MPKNIPSRRAVSAVMGRCPCTSSLIRLGETSMSACAEPPPPDETPGWKERRETLIPTNTQLTIKFCIEDNWSAQAVECFKTSSRPQDCTKHLTPEQLDKTKLYKDKEIKATADGTAVNVEVVPKAEPPKPESPEPGPPPGPPKPE